MARSSLKILVVELNQVFDSISAAAAAVGADASNVSKAVKGQRRSAGGYHFENVTNDYSELAIKEAVKANISNRRKRAAEKKVAREKKQYHNKLVNQVHDALIDINQRYKNALEAGTTESDPILKKLISHMDYFGTTKHGLYRVSKSHLTQFSNTELSNLLENINAANKDYANSKSTPRNAASLALQFGISVEQFSNYSFLLPAMMDLFKIAKNAELEQYADIRNEIYAAMQGDIDPDELGEFVNLLGEIYSGNDLESLNTLLDQWYELHPDYEPNTDWEHIE